MAILDVDRYQSLELKRGCEPTLNSHSTQRWSGMVQQPKQYPSKTFSEIKSEAVMAAIAGNWQQAVDLNYQAVDAEPGDAGSFNRLATALIELGRFTEARQAAEKALALSPENKIARKHVERLSQLDGKVASTPVTSGSRFAAKFITDSAKATVTELINPAPPRVLATVSPGQELKVSDNGVRMELNTRAGERIGTLEVHIAQRIRKLTDRGNEYEFSVAKLSDTSIAVLVAETRSASGLTGVVSFPPSLQKTVNDIDLDDEMVEDEDDSMDAIEHDDEDSITPEAERNERLKSIMSGRLGSGYDAEDAGLEI